jgi:PTS system mannose-specific IIC component
MPLSELPFTHGLWLVYVVVGGLVAVDAVSWPQVMISRPLVSATVGGALLGDASAGLLVGAILELFSMRHPPLGAARYPDTGPAGLVAGASFAAAGGSAILALVAALLGGWALGWIGTASVYARRRVNERLVTPVAELAARPDLLERRHRLAIWMDVFRGAFLVAAFLVPTAALTGFAAGKPVGPVLLGYAGAALLLGIATTTGASARMTAFGLRGWPLLLAGAGAALLVLVVAT